MKKNILFILLPFFCLGSVVFSQPLNNSFENWAGGMPVDWVTSGQTSVTQVSVAYEGSSAAHLEVIEFGGFAFPPSLQSLTSSSNGHPVTEKHGSLQGWYQLMPLGDDGLIVSVFMRQGTNSVGGGSIVLPATTTGWTQFSVPILYPPDTPNPDNTIITFSIIDTLGALAQVGSMGYVDYLTFTGPTDVEHISGLPHDYNLSQNYPNPFNPSTIIEYSIPEESFVELKVFDILGNEVATLVSEQQAAGVYRVDFNANNIPTGLYFARLTSNEFTKVIKMTLLK